MPTRGLPSDPLGSIDPGAERHPLHSPALHIHCMILCVSLRSAPFTTKDTTNYDRNIKTLPRRSSGAMVGRVGGAGVGVGVGVGWCGAVVSWS